MKVVLVIDIPSELDVNNLLIDYCVHTKGEYKMIRKGGNHPLKPLPNRWIPQLNGLDIEQQIRNIDFAGGWNACIEKIAGETE